MKKGFTVFALALCAVAASSAGGQVQVKVTGVNAPGQTSTTWDPDGSGTKYSPFYVSPYAGTIVGSNNTLVLNCVDFFHEVSVGQTYWANQTYLNSGDLTATRFNNLEWYLQAAWLSQQYNSPDPGSNDDRRIAIQAAIWNIFTPDAPDRDIAYTANDSETWLAKARLASNWQSMDASKFFVLTDVNKASGSSAQEFLVYDPNRVVTPEPATLILLGTGMAGLAAARRRRKKTL